MTYRFHPEAEPELQEAYDYYESRQQGLGRRFGQAFDEGLSKILENPFAAGVLEEPYRLIRLKRFPYGILYNIRDPEQELVIVAVMHLHRRPGYWKQRVK